MDKDGNDTPVKRNIAVYWDFENIHGALYKWRKGEGWYGENRYRSQEPLVDVAAVMKKISAQGSVMINKAYANWQSFGRYGRILLENSIESIQHFPPKARKNGADIRLAIDLFEDLRTNPHLTTFVLVTGDSDFIPVIEKVRQQGKEIQGIGVADAVDGVLEEMFDTFVYYSDLVGSRGTIDGPTRNWKALEKALASTAAQYLYDALTENPPAFKRWKKRIRDVDSGFDLERLGFDSLEEAIESYCEDLGMVETESDKDDSADSKVEAEPETRESRPSPRSGPRRDDRSRDDRNRDDRSRDDRSRDDRSRDDRSRDDRSRDDRSRDDRSRDDRSRDDRRRDGGGGGTGSGSRNGDRLEPRSTGERRERESDGESPGGPISGAIDILYATFGDANQAFTKESAREALNEGIGAANHTFSVDALMRVLERIVATTDAFEEVEGGIRLRPSIPNGAAITESYCEFGMAELKTSKKPVDDATFRSLARTIFGQSFRAEQALLLKELYQQAPGTPGGGAPRGLQLPAGSAKKAVEQPTAPARDPKPPRAKKAVEVEAANALDSSKTGPESRKSASDSSEGGANAEASKSAPEPEPKSQSPEEVFASRVSVAVGKRMNANTPYEKLVLAYYRAFAAQKEFFGFRECVSAVQNEFEKLDGSSVVESEIGPLNSVLKNAGALKIETAENRKKSVLDSRIQSESQLLGVFLQYLTRELTKLSDSVDWKAISQFLAQTESRADEFRKLCEAEPTAIKPARTEAPRTELRIQRNAAEKADSSTSAASQDSDANATSKRGILGLFGHKRKKE